MFLHAENKELLWKTLQKSPYLVEFTQKFAGYREVWFQGIMETFYTHWISKNNWVPTNARELLEINKHAVQFIIADIKRLLGYLLSSQPSDKINVYSQESNMPTSYVNPIQMSQSPTNNVMLQNQNQILPQHNDLPSYNVSEERQRREEQWSSNFTKYQSEYNNLLKRPELPMSELPTNSIDEKITNIEELVKEHARMRDMDLTIYAKPSSSSQQANQKLKIMNDLERVEMEIVSYDSPSSKSVHWSENLSECQ